MRSNTDSIRVAADVLRAKWKAHSRAGLEPAIYPSRLSMAPGKRRFAFPMFFRVERIEGRMDFKEATKQLQADLEGAIRCRDKAVSRLPPHPPLSAAETVGDGYL